MLSVLTTINYTNNFAYHGDLLVVAITAVLVGVYGFILWRHQILINLLAIYIGMLGASLLGLSLGTNNQLESIIKLPLGLIIILLFGLFWLMAILILSFSHLIKKVSYNHSFIWRWLQALVSGLVHGGLIFSFVIAGLPQEYLAYFSAGQLKLLHGSFSQIAWFILSLLSLLVIRNKKRGPGRPSL